MTGKSAILTALEDGYYKLVLYDGRLIHKEHVWKNKARLLDVLKKAGMRPRKGGCTKFWPALGEKVHIIIDKPASWFWGTSA